VRALPLAPQVGDTYEITLARILRSGAAMDPQEARTIKHDHRTGDRPARGRLELQYDLPNAATADERARIAIACPGFQAFADHAAVNA